MSKEEVLSPSGTTIIDGHSAGEFTEPGVHIIREPKDLYLWAELLAPEVDDSEAVSDLDQLPQAENSILFGILREPQIRVIHPIPVEIKRDGETVVASWQEADEYGYGRDRSEALEDFGRTISQLYTTLSRDEQMLGSEMQRVLDVLRRHMQFRSR